MSKNIGVVAEATSSVGQNRTICNRQGGIPRYATLSAHNLLAGKMVTLIAFECINILLDNPAAQNASLRDWGNYRTYQFAQSKHGMIYA
jgi:hypothetical protein